MAGGVAEIKIAKSPDEVWKIVGDFGGLGGWMPGIESCELEGHVRKLGTMGIEIHEQLRELSEDDRRIAYGIVQSPMPLERHHAVIAVTADGDGSHVTWEVEVLPDEMLPAFLPIYEQSLGQLKSHLEG